VLVSILLQGAHLLHKAIHPAF